MKNIMALYRDNEMLVPFVVRRQNWSDNFALLVTSVEVEDGKMYGNAYGWQLTPLNGFSSRNPYWGLPGKPKKISCAGCWQWSIVENLPQRWIDEINQYYYL